MEWRDDRTYFNRILFASCHLPLCCFRVMAFMRVTPYAGSPWDTVNFCENDTKMPQRVNLCRCWASPVQLGVLPEARFLGAATPNGWPCGAQAKGNLPLNGAGKPKGMARFKTQRTGSSRVLSLQARLPQQQALPPLKPCKPWGCDFWACFSVSK